VWLTMAGSFCFCFASMSAGQEMSGADETTRLHERIRQQQQQLDDLRNALEEQRRAVEGLRALIVKKQPDGADSPATAAWDTAATEATLPGSAGAHSSPAPTSMPAAREAPGVPFWASAHALSRDGAEQAAGSAQQPPNPTQEVAGERPEGPALELGPARLRGGGIWG
jgi:hypothetical protein